MLFGTRRGSYTDAVDRTGLVAAAQGGTLFLDELHALPLEGQAKLLRVLDTGEVQRLGDERARHVRFRLIAAVQEDIEERIARGEFRRDLFARCSGYVLYLPPLDERPDDLMPLARYFAECEKRTLHPDCDRVLQSRSWRGGNVRELKFAVQRAAVLADGGVITPVILAKSLAMMPAWERSRRRLFPADAQVLDECEAHGWRASSAAASLQISRVTLWRRLEALGVSLRDAKQRMKNASLVQSSRATSRMTESHATVPRP